MSKYHGVKVTVQPDGGIPVIKYLKYTFVHKGTPLETYSFCFVEDINEGTRVEKQELNFINIYHLYDKLYNPAEEGHHEARKDLLEGVGKAPSYSIRIKTGHYKLNEARPTEFVEYCTGLIFNIK